MDFKDIPQFPRAHYQVNVGWTFLETWLGDFAGEHLLDLDPDYQRGHVWTSDQQTAYVEFILQGGESSRVLYWNHASWMTFEAGDKMELVDWQSAGNRECRIVYRHLHFHVYLTQLAEGRTIVMHSHQWGEDLEQTMLAALRLAVGTEEA